MHGPGTLELDEDAHYDMDIGPAGSTYTLGIGTGNARASRTGPGPNIP